MYVFKFVSLYVFISHISYLTSKLYFLSLSPHCADATYGVILIFVPAGLLFVALSFFSALNAAGVILCVTLYVALAQCGVNALFFCFFKVANLRFAIYGAIISYLTSTIYCLSNHPALRAPLHASTSLSDHEGNFG